MTPSLWDTTKAALKGKNIATYAIRRRKISHNQSRLTLETRKRKTKPKVNRIIKTRAKINESVLKKKIERINETKRCIIEKITKINRQPDSSKKKRDNPNK